MMGFPANPRATTSSPVFFFPRQSARMIPPSTFIENGTDPISITSMAGEADLRMASFRR